VWAVATRPAHLRHHRHGGYTLIRRTTTRRRLAAWRRGGCSRVWGGGEATTESLPSLPPAASRTRPSLAVFFLDSAPVHSPHAITHRPHQTLQTCRACRQRGHYSGLLSGAEGVGRSSHPLYRRAASCHRSRHPVRHPPEGTLSTGRGDATPPTGGKAHLGRGVTGEATVDLMAQLG
jgi:hypothetical protein